MRRILHAIGSFIATIFSAVGHLLAAVPHAIADIIGAITRPFRPRKGARR